MRTLALLFVTLVLAGCSGAAQPSKPAVAAQPTATAPPQPAATPPPPTATPIPPTPKPAEPPLTAELHGTLSPARARVGQDVTVRLAIKNLSSRSYKNLTVRMLGDWRKFTVLRAKPESEVRDGLLARDFQTPLSPLAGLEVPFVLVLSPNEPGNHRLTFFVLEGTRHLVDTAGQDYGVEFKLAVTG